MPTVTRDDGARISWSERGEGPPVILIAHWWAHPAVLENLAGELARDHRMVTYDRRGTGDSSSDGPFDGDTDVADLIALLEAIGDASVLVGWGDGAMLAVPAAVQRPELARAVIAVGGNPLGPSMAAGTDSPAASTQVREALRQTLRTDYRSAIRNLVRHSNLEMNEEQMRRRVEEQVRYCPQEVAVARFESWAQTDITERAAELGDRLAALFFPTDLGTPEEFVRATSAALPKARTQILEDGPISRPDLTADAVRRVTAPLRSGSGTAR
jgi:pimeloyl-ACP methyl ester carboxylesterase